MALASRSTVTFRVVTPFLQEMRRQEMEEEEEERRRMRMKRSSFGG